MKSHLFTSVLCCFALLATPNFAIARHGGGSHFHHHHSPMRMHHHGHFGGYHHHHFHHHHPYRYRSYSRIGWAAPAVFLLGGIVGASIVSSQNTHQYISPPHQLPAVIYPNPYSTNYPYQPPPPPQQPIVNQSTAPPPDNGYWHYCPSAKQYYPYVRTCPEAWLEVVPR